MDRGRENGSSSAPPPDFPHPFHKLRKNSSSPNNHNQSLQNSPTIKSLGVVNPPSTKNVGTGANLGRTIPLAHGQLGIPTSTASSGAINLSSDQASSSANSKPEPNSSRELVKYEGSQKSEGEAPAAASKIVSQNVNGTLALTGIPRTESELQLFRVLQRGNLLAYFDVMIELGGDDVQQLCEAGEEEFLEIMSLIGMSSKPLHVRRLQKALQEWMSNPALFQTPVLPPGVALTNGHHTTTLTPSSSPPAQIQIPQTRTSPQPQLPIRPIPYHHNSPAAAAIAAAAQHHAKLTISTVTNGHNHHSSNSNSPNGSIRSNDHSSSNGYRNGELRIPLDQLIPSHFLEQRIRTNSQPASPAPSDSPSESSSHSPLPFLQDHELIKLNHAAGQIVKNLPPYVFTPQIPSKRKFSGDYEAIIRLPPNDPRRVEEMRKMSTIYGRADSSSSTVPNKRKYPKPLSLHEVAVNEAAGQLVRHVPALLTYRDELCALAKQVVRDSGLSFAASSAPSTNGLHIYSQLNNNSLAYSNQNKKELTNGHSSLAVEPYSGAKRLRLGDHGLEIQEYSRPPSNHSSNSSNDEGSGLQITPITNLPSRVSPLSPLPLELVTVSSNSPSSRRGSSEIGHSPSRRASGSSSSDLNNVQPPKNGLRVTSVGVSGGSINISHDPSIRVTSSSPNGPLLPIKSEPSSS